MPNTFYRWIFKKKKFVLSFINFIMICKKWIVYFFNRKIMNIKIKNYNKKKTYISKRNIINLNFLFLRNFKVSWVYSHKSKSKKNYYCSKINNQDNRTNIIRFNIKKRKNKRYKNTKKGKKSFNYIFCFY